MTSRTAWRITRAGLLILGLGHVLAGFSARAQASALPQEDRSALAEAVPGRDVPEWGRPAQSEAQTPGAVARAARLTFLEGEVTVAREDMPLGEPAVLNMPLAQGMRLSASARGQAEIEFEDGSLVRLTPNSSLRLDFLGSDSKSNVTIAHALSGLLYCELRVSRMGRFSLTAGGEQMWPLENATVRINLDDPPTVYSVLTGKVMVEHVARTSAGTERAQSIVGFRTEVRAGESLRSDATDASRYFLAAAIPPETWDSWNEERDQAAANALASETPVRGAFAGAQGYGWSDLDTSGTWYDQPGQGPVWQPAEALSVGFDPYGYGNWTYFPGGGYSWASSYSWGWTPYRCGFWNYWEGFGWGWQPDRFCRTNWRFGLGRGNVGVGPRGYVPVRVPVRAPAGVHPILAGPHPGERPPAGRGGWERHDPAKRRIAGVAVAPIAPSGHGVTPRGGSAVGSALRRDYAVDDKTRNPVVGLAPDANRAVPVSPVSAAPGWRAVSTRPEPPAPNSGGAFHGLFGRTSHTEQAAPLRIDGHGNPYLAPAQRPATASTSTGTTDHAPVRGGSQPVTSSAAHSQPMPQQAGHPQATPQQSFHAAPASAPAPHMEVHASPAASSSAAAPSKK